MYKITIFTCLIFNMVGLKASQGEPFSVSLQKASQHIHHAVMHHPFNQKLLNGTLDPQKFLYYIHQDAYYLQNYARSLALIAAKFQDKPKICQFLKYAEAALIAETEQIHRYFIQQLNGKNESFKCSFANLTYTSFLLKTCAMDTLEEAVAAILPCFWLYREVGQFMVKQIESSNPYLRWVQIYASQEFSDATNEVFAILDELAENASEKLKVRMMDAFCKTCVLEWHFWNDAFEERHFMPIELSH